MTPDEFRRAREFLGLEVRWVAAHLGVTVRQVNRWENGVTPIPARAVQALEGFLAEYVPTWGCTHCPNGFASYERAKAHTGRHDATIIWPGLPWAPEVVA